MAWKQQHFEALARIRREDRYPACERAHRLRLHGGAELYVATDARSVVALDQRLCNGIRPEAPELDPEGSEGRMLREVLEAEGIGRAFPLRELREWAGDPAAGPRPGTVRGVPVDRALLAARLAPFGTEGTVLTAPGAVRGVPFLRVFGEGWSVVIMEFHVPGSGDPLPAFTPSTEQEVEL